MKRSRKAWAMFIALAPLAWSQQASAGPYNDAVLADNPVAYWRLGEQSGSAALNEGLLGQADIGHGTYTEGTLLGQPALVVGETNGSAYFSPGGRMVSEPFEKFDEVAGIGGTGFSVEFWTSFSTTPGGFVNLVGDGEGGGDFNMMVYAGSGGFIRPHVQTDFGHASIDSVRQIQPGEVVHVVSTWDYDSGDFLLYLDGQEAEVTVSAGDSIWFGELVNRDNPVFIGQDGREPSPVAWLDEVALYNYPLAPARVQAHYAAGQGAMAPTLPDIPLGPPNVNVSLSTDVLGTGTFSNGHTTSNGMVEIIRQVPNSASANVVPYTADAAGPTIDVADWIVDGGTAGGFGSNQHGRGGNLWVAGDGEADVPHEGLGGHANWIVTYDLEEVRKDLMGGAAGPLRLTGSYGSWGSIGSTDPTAGITQGLVFVDGQRVDALNQTTHNVPQPGGTDSPSQEIDITVPADARYLTLGLMSGPDSTLWDDGVFRNVRLRVANPTLDRQDGLVSYWHFDEAAEGNAPAQDQPGGNLGVFQGAAERTAGLIGAGAAEFDNSTGDAVNVGAGDDNNMSFTSGITIEALIQTEWSGQEFDYDEIFRKEDGGNRLLLSFQNDPNNGGANPPVDPGPVLSFGLNVEGYGELDMPLDGEDGRPTLEEIANGETHHIVASYDSETGEKAIWINGEKLWSVDLGAGALITSGGGAQATIGNVGPGGGEPFTGTIDEVALWNRALSADEIAAHYANVLAGSNYFGGLTQPGDYDFDGQLTVNDVDLLSAEIQAGTNRQTFDLNDDGLVNSADLEQLITSPDLFNTYLGDANLDGVFNSGDLVTVFQIGRYESGEAATWAEGDWTGDGFFTSSDFVAAFQGGGYEAPPREAVSAVPEPAGIALLLCGSVFLWGRSTSRRPDRV